MFTIILQVNKISKSFLLFLFILFIFALPTELGASDYLTKIPAAIIDPGKDEGHILVIDKGKQESYLYEHNSQGFRLLKEMPCSTGEKQGDKLLQDDLKTPEGYYIFNTKMVETELSELYGVLAYPMDYPNFWDEKLGRTGYGIWAHGITKEMKDYDSKGCVEFTNLDIIELEKLIKLYDTPILVYENLELKDIALVNEEAKKLHDFLESWRTAWVNKNQSTYQDKYDKSFTNSDKRSYDDWMQNKKNLTQTYKNISVELKDIKLYWHRDIIVAIFKQHYSGDSRFKSVGLKRLYIKKIGINYKIVGESFRPLPNLKTSKWLTAAEKNKALLAKQEPPDSKILSVSASTNGSPLATGKASLVFGLANMPVLVEKANPNVATTKQPLALATAKADLVLEEKKELIKISAVESKPIEAGSDVSPKVDLEVKAKKEIPKVILSPEAEIKEIIKNWSNSWESKNQKKYFSYYAQDYVFKDKNMKLAAFKKYRSNLMNKTSKITVKTEQLKVKIESDKAKVTFIQNYQADKYKDKGHKTLILKKLDSGWKITEESWRPLR